MFRDIIEKWQGANPADQIRKSWQGQRPDILLRILDNPTDLWADDDVARDIRRIPGLLQNHVARLFNDGSRDEAALLKGRAQARYAALAQDDRLPAALCTLFARAQADLEDHFTTMAAPGTVELERQFEQIRTSMGLPAAIVFMDHTEDDFGKSGRVRRQLASFAIQIAPDLVEAGHAGLARRVLSNACTWAQGTRYHAAAAAMIMAVFPDIAPRA